MAKNSGSTRKSTANAKGEKTPPLKKELKGYGDILSSQITKVTQALSNSVTDKSLIPALNDLNKFVEKYTNFSNKFEEKQFWKDYYKVNNQTNNSLNDNKADSQGKALLGQCLDMMKVLAAKYHGLKIYDKSLANFKLKPLSEIKKK